MGLLGSIGKAAGKGALKKLKGKPTHKGWSGEGPKGNANWNKENARAIAARQQAAAPGSGMMSSAERDKHNRGQKRKRRAEVRKLVRQGVSPADARKRAEQQFPLMGRKLK